MAKKNRKLTTVSVRIGDLVGSKGTGVFLAKAQITLSYDLLAKGAPCKVKFHQGDEFNGVFTKSRRGAVVEIRGDSDMASLVLTLPPMHRVRE